jgi:short-subunit dehydrogenase
LNGKGHILVVGATSAIAQHCLRLWAARAPASVTLLGRDETELARTAADLAVRAPGAAIRTASIGPSTPEGIAAALVAMPTPPDLALVAFGMLPDQGRCQADLARAEEALMVNGVAPALWAEAIAGAMVGAGRGTVVLLGSVAGDRGRKANYVYGAAKGLLARYAEGLQHRLAKTDVRVVLAKPGPTDTPMTAALKARGARLAPVNEVARRIVEAADRGVRVVYAPARWRLIMLVIRHLPSFVFDRLNV